MTKGQSMKKNAINDKALLERAKRNEPEALRLVGEKKLKDGDKAAAKKYLRLAMQLGDAAACYTLGQLYLQDGETNMAVEVFREGKRNGDEGCTYSLMATLLRLGDEDALAFITDYADADDRNSIEILYDYYKAGGNNKQAAYWKKRLDALHS